MKKTKFPLWTACLFAVLLSSCDKEDELTNETPETPACLITQMGDGNGDFDEVTFTYTSDNKLSKVVMQYAYESCYYDGEQEVCENYAGTETIEYLYNSEGILNQVKFYEIEDGETAPDDLETINFVYVDGKLNKLTIVEYPDDELRFTYVGNKLSTLEGYENNIKYSSTDLTWTGENITGVKEYYDSESGGRNLRSKFLSKALQPKKDQRTMAFELEGESTFSNYDDKNNPFQGNLIFAMFMDGFYFLGKNNVGKIEDKGYWNGELDYDYTINLSFQYNEQGFPIQYGYSDTDGETATITIAYDCE